MSGFLKISAGSHAPTCAYQNYDFTARIIEDCERCLTPANTPSSRDSFEYCNCCCHGHIEQQEEGAAQSRACTPEMETGQKSESAGEKSVAESGKDKLNESISPSIEVLSDEREAKITYLICRRAEIYTLMVGEMEEEILGEKKRTAATNTRLAEVEKMKMEVMKSMSREQRMTIVKQDFIRILRNVDFDHEVEDVYGSGMRIFRSFRESGSEV